MIFFIEKKKNKWEETFGLPYTFWLIQYSEPSFFLLYSNIWIFRLLSPTSYFYKNIFLCTHSAPSRTMLCSCREHNTIHKKIVMYLRELINQRNARERFIIIGLQIKLDFLPWLACSNLWKHYHPKCEWSDYSEWRVSMILRLFRKSWYVRLSL